MKITWTYNKTLAAHLEDEIVTIPDQVGDTDALIESLIKAFEGSRYEANPPLPTMSAQRFHDNGGTVFPLQDGRLAQLDGEAYGLWTTGTGDIIVMLAPR